MWRFHNIKSDTSPSPLIFEMIVVMEGMTMNKEIEFEYRRALKKREELLAKKETAVTDIFLLNSLQITIDLVEEMEGLADTPEKIKTF